jgi:hypothetical protein
LKFTYAAEVILEASGGSAATTIIVAANDTSLTSANHYDYPLADFALTCDFGAAVAAGTRIDLYRRDFDITASGIDAPAPSAAYPYRLVGAFPLPNGQSASDTYPCPDVPLSRVCQFSVGNATAQTMTAGWILKATPKSFVPGA